MKPPLPELWLHVGTHKTGTTSIQKMLQDLQSSLAQRDVAVWTEHAGRTNAFGLAHSFIRADLQTPIRLSRGAAEPAADRVAFEIWAANLRAPRAIVSSEAFSFLRTAEEFVDLKSVLTRRFARVRPVLVLRNEVAWRRSWRQQLTRRLLLPQIEALPETARVTANWYFDKIALRAFWAGIGPLTVLDYDHERAVHGSIIPGFLQVLDLSDLPLPRDYQLNVSETL